MSLKGDLLLQTTHKLVDNLGDGFLLEAKGKTLVHYTPDKEMKIEIEFLLPRKRNVENVKVFPHVQICSKALKKWWKDEKLPEPTDVFFYSALDDIIPRTMSLGWIISEDKQEKSINDMTNNIRLYVTPFFDMLTDTGKAVEFMCEKVWAISRNIRMNLYYPPIDFVLYYGSNDMAYRLFKTCIKQNMQWAHQAAIRYKELDARKGQTVEQIFKSGNRWINLSYMCGFRP